MEKITSLRQLARSGSSEAKRADIYRIDPRILVVDTGFNIRMQDNPDLRPHIDSLKETIKNWLIENKDHRDNHNASHGIKVIPPISVFINDDGQPQLADGHHRTIAVHELIAEGHDILFMDTLEVPNDPRQLARLKHRSAMSLQLTPIEKAIYYTEYADKYDMKVPEIVAELAKDGVKISNQRIEQLLLLGRADPQIHHLVSVRKITADSAIEVIRKHRGEPGKALEVIIQMCGGNVDEDQTQTESEKPQKTVGRGTVRKALTRKTQDRMYAALLNNKDALKEIEKLRQAKGEAWGDSPVGIVLPADVVAELFARTSTEQPTEPEQS